MSGTPSGTPDATETATLSAFTHPMAHKSSLNDRIDTVAKRYVHNILPSPPSIGCAWLRQTSPVIEANMRSPCRLQTELMNLMMNAPPGISAFPASDTSLLSWNATITGPADTPYAGLMLKLSFGFGESYPYKAPDVRFKTPIFHPNIDFSGRICLDILGSKWTASYTVQTVLLSLQSLLGEPNK